MFINSVSFHEGNNVLKVVAECVPFQKGNNALNVVAGCVLLWPQPHLNPFLRGAHTPQPPDTKLIFFLPLIKLLRTFLILGYN